MEYVTHQFSFIHVLCLWTWKHYFQVSYLTVGLFSSQYIFQRFSAFYCIHSKKYMFKTNNRNTRQRCEICTSEHWRKQGDVKGVVLVSLLLILKIFRTFFQCFYCWLCFEQMFVGFAAEYSKSLRWREHRLIYTILELAPPLCFSADIFRMWCNFTIGP